MVNIPDDFYYPSDSPNTPFNGYETTVVETVNGAPNTQVLQPTDYLLCLTNYDSSRIESVTSIARLRKPENRDLVVDPIQKEVCSIPTLAPTTDPTTFPTSDPTDDPTSDPTTDPTFQPTESPIPCPSCYCLDDSESDFIFVIDTSCISDSECDAYTEGIAELAALTKPRTLPRQGFITYDGQNDPQTVIFLNDTDYNDFINNGYNTLDNRKDFYDEVRSIECNGNGGDTSDKSANTIAAIKEAMKQFQYEEDTYLPDVSCEFSSATRRLSECQVPFRYCLYNGVKGDCTGRTKRIILISNCLNTQEFNGQTGENAVCEAFKDESDRTPVAGNGEVEFVVFNTFTTESTISANSYSCLTNGDSSEIIYGGTSPGGDSNPITLQGMIGTEGLPNGEPERVATLAYEICEDPTPAPTLDPTSNPTQQPTTEEPTKNPTDLPTYDPTTDPTKRPTDPPISTCTCDDLRYTFEEIDADCPSTYSCHGCTPNYCDPGANCFTYKLKKTEGCGKSACKDDEPAFIVLPKKDNCSYTFGYDEMWWVLETVTDLTDDKNEIEYNFVEYPEIDDYNKNSPLDPEELTNTYGIKIPISDYDCSDDSFTFEICLYGVSDRVQNMKVGFGYRRKSRGCNDYEYGYQCEPNIPLPDICQEGIMQDCVKYGAGKGPNGHSLVDLMHEGKNPHTSINNNGFHNNNKPSSPIFTTIYTSYSQWIFMAILAIFMLNVCICTYIKCIRKNLSRPEHKKYGVVGKDSNDDTVDDSDGTDSEVDSDEQLVN